MFDNIINWLSNSKARNYSLCEAAKSSVPIGPNGATFAAGALPKAGLLATTTPEKHGVVSGSTEQSRRESSLLFTNRRPPPEEPKSLKDVFEATQQNKTLASVQRAPRPALTYRDNSQSKISATQPGLSQTYLNKNLMSNCVNDEKEREKKLMSDSGLLRMNPSTHNAEPQESLVDWDGLTKSCSVLEQQSNTFKAKPEPFLIDTHLDATRYKRQVAEAFGRAQGREEAKSDHDHLNAGPHSVTSARLRQAAEEATIWQTGDSSLVKQQNDDSRSMTEVSEAATLSNVAAGKQTTCVSNGATLKSECNSSNVIFPVSSSSATYCVWSILGLTLVATALQHTFDFLGDRKPPS